MRWLLFLPLKKLLYFNFSVELIKHRSWRRGLAVRAISERHADVLIRGGSVKPPAPTSAAYCLQLIIVFAGKAIAKVFKSFPSLIKKKKRKPKHPPRPVCPSPAPHAPLSASRQLCASCFLGFRSCIWLWVRRGWDGLVVTWRRDPVTCELDVFLS